MAKLSPTQEKIINSRKKMVFVSKRRHINKGYAQNLINKIRKIYRGRIRDMGHFTIWEDKNGVLHEETIEPKKDNPVSRWFKKALKKHS